MAEAIIKTRDLTRKYGSYYAINKLNLAMVQGNIYALLGPNGAGKTTTIKLISGIIRPTSGQSFINGADSQQLTPAHWQQIGYVSENQRLYNWMKIGEIIAFTSGLYDNWDRAFEKFLRKKLSLNYDLKIRHCSRGETVKLKLLLALSFHPKILILDEPFSGLDMVTQEEFIESLLEITGQQEWSVFLASHNLYEVEKLADHVAIIDHGALMINESLDDLQNRFKKIHITSDSALKKSFKKKEYLLYEQSERSVSFIHAHFNAEEKKKLLQQFVRARITIDPVDLKEIFKTIVKGGKNGHNK